MSKGEISPGVPHDSNNFDGARTTRRNSFWPQPPQEWVDALRKYLRDFAEQNELLDFSQESEDNELRDAWGMALVDWNGTPPMIPATNFSAHPNRYLLILKATVIVLQSVSYRLMRNELEFNAGAVSYNIKNQWQKYENAIAKLTNEYEDKKALLKQTINMERAFGDSGSEFGRTGNTFDQLSG